MHWRHINQLSGAHVKKGVGKVELENGEIISNLKLSIMKLTDLEHRPFKSVSDHV